MPSTAASTSAITCRSPRNEPFGYREGDQKPNRLKLTLSDKEKATELALLRHWGIRNPSQAPSVGIDWPETAYKDFWK